MKIKSILLLLCVFLCMSAISSAQEKLSGRVIGVVSGDTITVLTKDRRQMMLSLAGIEAPQKEQEFGVSAHQFLSALILDQIVMVSNIKEDCRGRKTASIAFNNKDLSLMAVKSGNAWADVRCEANGMLAKEEASARTRGIGLWENPNAAGPSNFVKLKQKPETEASETSSRRIFTGLAPTPPPPKNSLLFIGMTLEDFSGICGTSGKKSSLTTTKTLQSFSLDVPQTPENIKKKCNGNFHFERESSDAPFKMWMANQ